MVLSHNYAGGLTLMRRSPFEMVGGFDASRGKALEWDVLLRMSEKTQKISRVPKCLYHRRFAPGTRPGMPPRPWAYCAITCAAVA